MTKKNDIPSTKEKLYEDQKRIFLDLRKIVKELDEENKKLEEQITKNKARRVKEMRKAFPKCYKQKTGLQMGSFLEKSMDNTVEIFSKADIRNKKNSKKSDKEEVVIVDTKSLSETELKCIYYGDETFVLENE